MKKYIVLLLTLALVISAASCGAKNGSEADIGEPSLSSGDTGTRDSQQTEDGKKAEEEAAKKAAEVEAAKKAAEEEAAKKAEEEAAKKAAEEEAAKKAAEEEAARKAEEEAAKKAAEAEAARKAEEEAAKKAAEEEAARKAAEEEAARKAAEEEAARKAEEEAAKKAAEEEAARKAAEEEAARKAAEEEAKRNEEENNGETDGGEEKPVPPSGGIIVPGFGGIGGGGSDSDGGEAPVLGDGSGLVADLEAVVGDSTGEMMNETYALTDSNSWQITNWFPGVTVSDGTKFAANTPMIGSIANVALLIEVPDGVDAAGFADELASHANPRWQICVSAESTQYEVSGNRILFVMSSQEIADAVISAFNG